MPDYFTLPELRALRDMGNTDRYPDARCEAAAAYIVGVIEREVGTSFVPRTVTEVHDGTGLGPVYLRQPYVLSLTSATEGGVPVDPASLTWRHGMLRRSLVGRYVQWVYGIRNITVTYEAGYSEEPPADVKDAALRGTRLRLLTEGLTQVDIPTGSVTTEAGAVLYVPPGPSNPTGFPDVDSVIVAWRDKLSVPTVA